METKLTISGESLAIVKDVLRRSVDPKKMNTRAQVERFKRMLNAMAYSSLTQ